ncbi:MAG: response regulator [Mucilaginibacter sp.]
MKNNILLVEDNGEIREYISERLSNEGYKVIKADCGCKAVKLADEQLPDLIVCDTKMKDMDGYEVFVALFKKLFKNNIPFIYFTKVYGEDDKKKVKILSLDNYLNNQFYDPNLMTCVKNCLPINFNNEGALC